MNQYIRQSRNPAASTPLPADIAAELSELPARVAAISDAPPLAPARAPLTQSEVRTILMSLLLTMFLAALDQTIVATALPTIARQFHDVSNLSWVITAYLLASTAVAPVFGTLSDIYGRRVMIIVSLSLFIAGSVLCALAPSLPILVMARVLQGLGGGGIMPVVQTVISDVVSARERGQEHRHHQAHQDGAGLGLSQRRARRKRRRIIDREHLGKFRELGVDLFGQSLAVGRKTALPFVLVHGEILFRAPPRRHRFAGCASI